jgi:dihydropteroate synthase
LRFADDSTLALGRDTAVMGVLNVTPDSFSDGGRHLDPQAALDAGLRMEQEGAALIDVGGESTRPGASPVEEAEEIRRVVGVVAALARRLSIPISVDTRKAAVACRALDAGARLINDVSALGDPAMLPLLRDRRAPIVLMHMRGEPATMQLDTRYEDLLGSVVSFLRSRVEHAVQGGVADDRILVDPGIGFGKSPADNLKILQRIPALAGLGRPILIGASRKSFLGTLLGTNAGDRLEGSLSAAVLAGAQGAHVVRAHDVAATVRALRVVDAVRGA